MQGLSRDALEAIVGSIPAGVVVIAKEKGKTLYANERAIQLFGFDPRGLEMPEHSTGLMNLLTPKGDVYPPEQLPASIALLTGKEAKAEVIIERHDGSRVITEGSAKPIKDVKGEVIAAVTVFEDITERKRIEYLCKDSEERFRGLVESTSDWIWQVDQNGVYTYVSPKVKEILGYEPEEVLGKTPFDFMPKKEAEDITRIFLETIKNKTVLHNLENLAVKKNGDIVVLETSGVPIENEKGNLVGYRGIDRDITERKKVEQALKESEQLYRMLFDNSEDGFMLLELLYTKEGTASDFRFLNLNSAYEKQTGAKASDVLGHKASEVVPELNKLVIPLSDKVTKTGNSKRIEVYDQYSNKWYDAFYFPFAKNQVGILFRDITQRKKAEEALRMEKERFESLANSLPEIVFEIDINGKLTFANRRGLEVMGYTKEDLAKDLGVFVLIAPQDRGRAIEDFKKTLNNEPSDYYEYVVVRKDGSTFPAIIVTSVIIEKKQSVGLRGIMIDITERKKAEEALRTSEEKFQNMFEQSPAVFEIYDENGFLIQVNHAWDKLWNVPREYAIGKYNILRSEQVNKIGFLPFVKRAYSGEVVYAPNQEFDASLEPQALNLGRKRWLNTTIYPIKRAHGEVTNIIVMHEDITEKRLLEKQLQDKERMATIGQTAGMVGHDLRNPLQSIAGEVYLAKGELDSLPDSESKACLQESIQTISDQVAYMDKIVSDLQTFVKPVDAKMEIIDLKPLITAVLAQTDLPKNIQASMQIGDRLLANADVQLLKRVLINLVTNAVQAMPEGGELILKAQAHDKGVQIMVEDTGTGIPDEIKSKIFMPLFTTKSKGQGFGLAVCKRVIEAQNGTITFESQVGKGTKFIVELPMTQ